MDFWTTRLAGKTECFVSAVSSAKIYVLDENNPFSTKIFVKQIPCSDESQVIKVMNLGRIAQNYMHPNICDTLQVVQERMFVYIVIRWEPSNLDEEIRKRMKTADFFPEEYLWQLLSKFVSAYAHLQEKKVSHRDVKPSNILLSEQGEPKICEFGCAKEMANDELSTFLGSAMYFSPLLRSALIGGAKRNDRINHNPFKSDVYSLGMTLIHATRLEFPTKLTLLNDLQEKIDILIDDISTYSDKWKAILRRMLTREEASRPDFLQLQQEINSASAPVLHLPYPQFSFNDDERIILIPDIIENEDPLIVEAVCGYSAVAVSPQLFQLAPCMISLSVVENATQRIHGVDMVWVIDCSFSMKYGRMQQLQEALTGLLSLLNHLDRVSIVAFSNQAERKCPLTRCTEIGKEKIAREIEKLRGIGTTNLAFGFVCGLEVLKQRRVKNTESIMLLFSDGESNEGLDAHSTSIHVLQASGIQREIIIHTFGLGFEIDTKLLLSLAEIGRGTFQSIDDSQSIKAAFSYILGNAIIMGVQNVSVSIRMNPGPVRVNLEKMHTRDGANVFLIPEIAGGGRKDLLFTLRSEYQTLLTEVIYPPVTAEISYKAGNRELTRNVPMIVKFVPWEQKTEVENRVVFENWYRVKGAEALWGAKEMADNKQFEKAVQRLMNAAELIGSSGYENNPIISALINDITAAIRLVSNNESWICEESQAKFASVYYSHYEQSASPSAPQYASRNQERVASQMA